MACALSEIFAIPLGLSVLTVLRVWPFSMLQPLQFVPEQRLCNIDFACLTVLFCRPWEQACPQKQASARALFAPIPKTRTRVRNILYDFLFLTGAFPVDDPFSASCPKVNYTPIADMSSIEFSWIKWTRHTGKITFNLPKSQRLCFSVPQTYNNFPHQGGELMGKDNPL